LFILFKLDSNWLISYGLRVIKSIVDWSSRYHYMGASSVEPRMSWAYYSGASRLDTAQLDTTNHSDQCLEAFHCSSAVSGSCPIDSCPNGGHSSLNTGHVIKINEASSRYLMFDASM